jgi:hypothetical protein
MDQVKATEYAKFVDGATLRKIARMGDREAKAALAMQAIFVKVRNETGQWPNKDAVAAQYFAAQSV